MKIWNGSEKSWSGSPPVVGWWDGTPCLVAVGPSRLGDRMGLTPRKEGVMEIGQAGMAVVVFLTTVSVVGAVLTAVVTQWDM